MRPRRARLGCRSQLDGTLFVVTSFNEAEARAPRMHPTLQALGRPGNLAAISTGVAEGRAKRAGFRTRSYLPCQTAHDFNSLARFERVWRSAHHIAARKHPAAAERCPSSLPPSFGIASDFIRFR